MPDASALLPDLDREIFYAFEVAGIARRDAHFVMQRSGGDEHVVRANHLASGTEVRPNARVYTSDVEIHRQHGYRSENGFHEGGAPGASLRAVGTLHAMQKLTRCDGGQRNRLIAARRQEIGYLDLTAFQATKMLVSIRYPKDPRQVGSGRLARPRGRRRTVHLDAQPAPAIRQELAAWKSDVQALAPVARRPHRPARLQMLRLDSGHG